MDVRGQSSVVSTLLLVTIGVTLAGSYYIFAQGLLAGAQTTLKQQLEEYTDYARRYIDITAAKARLLPGGGAQIVVTITNNGDAPIPIYNASRYVYRDGEMITGGPFSPSGPLCPNPIPPGGSCVFDFYTYDDRLSTRSDFYESSIVVYLNNARKTAPITFVGAFPGQAIYEECHSCSECTAMLSSAKPSEIVVISIPSAQDGNCVTISGVHDVIVYCKTKIVGKGSGTGIQITDSNNISVRSCEVTGFDYGIYVKNSQKLSFESDYIHDNHTLDFVVDPTTITDICTFDPSALDITTTSGYVYVATGSTGSVSPLGVSALWLFGTSSTTVSGVSGANALSRVSPAIALCDTTSTSVSTFSISDTDVGVLLSSDKSTHIDTLDVSADVYGIYSTDSNNGYVCCSTFSSPSSSFIFPNGFEWDENTTFK